MSIGRSLGSRSISSSGTALSPALPVPPPPVPPVAPPAAAPVTLAPGALVVTPTQVLAPLPDPLNVLTDAQFAALQRRQVSVRGAIPTARIGRFTGPSYPFGPSWALTLGPKTDLEVVFTSVVNILTTPIGSVPHRPFQGSEIPNLVFEPNDSVTRGLIRYFVERDIGRQEERVVIETVRTVVPEDNPHKVIITVAFRIVGDPDNRIFSAPIEYDTLTLAA